MWPGATAVGRLEVVAEPTVFHATDTGRVLVRFVVSGTDAPAARLRIYDRTRRFIGTAGLLPVRPGHLLGEFWLPIAARMRISTDLELPNRRNPITTNHVLLPPPQWELLWIALVSGADFAHHLRTLDPARATLETRSVADHLRVNPLVGQPRYPLTRIDHLSPMGALPDLADETGIPVSNIALLDTADADSTLPVLLDATAIELVVTPSAAGVHWLEAPGGVRALAVGLAAGADAGELGFRDGIRAMAPRIENFIRNLPQTATSSHRAVVVSHEFGPDYEAMRAAVASWNGRFAFPRITPAGAETATTILVSNLTDIPTEVIATRQVQVPDAGELAALASRRRDERDREFARLERALAVASRESQSFENIAFPVAGTIVLNAAPTARSDRVHGSAGVEFIATDVPAFGYAFFPGAPRPAEPRIDSALTIGNGVMTVRVDPSSGSIVSLMSADGAEWVGSRGSLNDVEHGQLRASHREVIPGYSRSLHLRRWSPNLGELITVIRLYDALPWLTIENTCLGDSPSVEYRFDVSLTHPSVRWDLTTAVASSDSDVTHMRHDTFVELATPDGSFHFRCLDSPHFTVANGSILSHAPSGKTVFRLQPRPGFVFDDEAWRFGWSAEPLDAIAVTGTGALRLPTFGTLVGTDRLDAVIIAMEPREDASVMIYLQDLVGVGGSVAVVPGIIRFGGAKKVDARAGGLAPLPLTDGVAHVELRPKGLAAVKLEELELIHGG